MQIELFGRPYNRTDRVQWTLEELGVPYAYNVLDVFGLEHRGPSLRARYPLARLPFVTLDGQVLFESGAIMIVLAERFRVHDLLPDRARAEVLQWLFFANSTLDAADESLPSGAPPGPFAPLVDVLEFLDGALADRDVIAGDSFSIADIALANNLKYVHERVGPFPRVAAYFARHTARPAYQRIKAQPGYARPL